MGNPNLRRSYRVSCSGWAAFHLRTMALRFESVSSSVTLLFKLPRRRLLPPNASYQKHGERRVAQCAAMVLVLAQRQDA